MSFYYTDYGEEIRRRFDPSHDPCHRNVPADQLLTYNPQKQITQLQMTTARDPAPQRDITSLVVHIDGACRNNGRPNARAAWGVFVGPDSPYNGAGVLDSGLPQTSTRAEIEALGHALDVVAKVTVTDFKLVRVKIATDSMYLVEAMSEWMEDWIENGGTTVEGRPVKHWETLKALHERLDEMEYGDDGGIVCQFWHVPREMNAAADRLANEALGA